MTTPIAGPRRILAVAGSGEDQPALQCALRLAETHGASLEVIACVEQPHDLSILSRLSGTGTTALVADAVERMRATLRERLARLAPGRDIPLVVTVGKVYLEVIRHVAAARCDFVVKAAEPLAGLERFLFSSTDQHLLRKCPCPVWLLTPDAPAAPKRIVAAVDLDIADADEPETLASLNRAVIDTALLLVGAEKDAELTVLHAWDAIGEGMIWTHSAGDGARVSAERYVNDVLDARQGAMRRFLLQTSERNGPGPRLVPKLARGTPEAVIHDHCRDRAADLVVMGTVARTGLGGVFIGNTAENIINRLECSVLAVKPEGFASPVLAR
ncbi:MAG: universal stress protein [Rubricella sp.]